LHPQQPFDFAGFGLEATFAGAATTVLVVVFAGAAGAGAAGRLTIDVVAGIRGLSIIDVVPGSVGYDAAIGAEYCIGAGAET